MLHQTLYFVAVSVVKRRLFYQLPVPYEQVPLPERLSWLVYLALICSARAPCIASLLHVETQVMDIT